MANRSKQAPAYTPTTWVKKVGDAEYERTATSIDDEVRYKFDGWLPKPHSAADVEKNAAAAAAATVVASPAGDKPRGGTRQTQPSD